MGHSRTGTAAGPARHARVLLAPGLTLMHAAGAAMRGLGWPSATLLILGGQLARAVYHTPALTPGGPRWIGYGPPRRLNGPWLAMGSATFGRGLHGEDAMHCHAMLTDAAGVPVGGHLSPEECILGADGLVAHAASAEGAGFTLRPDASTGFTLLTPA